MIDEAYLDNAATTKTDDDVVQKIITMLTENYGNPSSLHRKGLQSELSIEHASREILSAIGATKGKLYFTSGGTEANNTAIFGSVSSKRGKGVVTTALEHSSVIDAVKELAVQGYDCRIVKPHQDGNIPVCDIVDACDEDTIFVSAMLVNNEIGAITDIASLVRAVRKKSPNAVIHTDAVQAFGKVPVNAMQLGVDMMTISGHKIYAPKGIGALYIADKVRIKPLLYGGEQQNKIRPGTENTAYIAGFGIAATRANKELKNNIEHALKLRRHLLERLSEFDGIIYNSNNNCSPFITNISILGIKSETILHFLEQDKIYVSSGSACAKGAGSHVLLSMGLPMNIVDSSLRISFSKHTTIEHLDRLVSSLKSAQSNLVRKMKG